MAVTCHLSDHLLLLKFSVFASEDYSFGTDVVSSAPLCDSADKLMLNCLVGSVVLLPARRHAFVCFTFFGLLTALGNGCLLSSLSVQAISSILVCCIC